MEGESIRKESEFRDFSGSMAFANKIAEVAESQNHHPDITIRWNKVRLTLTTHSQKSFTMNDFIMAAKIDAIK